MGALALTIADDYCGAAIEMRPYLVTVSILFLVSACAQTEKTSTRGGYNLISSEEIESAGIVFMNAEEIVYHFRNWRLSEREVVDKLNPPQGQEPSLVFVAVYQDDTRLGRLQELRYIPAEEVREIEYLDAARATRLGYNPVGAVVVRSK
jgi:hypothetical protein